jgi:hypothetical protein
MKTVVVTGLSPRPKTDKRGRVVVSVGTGCEVGDWSWGARRSARTSTIRSPMSLLDIKAEDNEKKRVQMSVTSSEGHWGRG